MKGKIILYGFFTLINLPFFLNAQHKSFIYELNYKPNQGNI